MADFAEFRAEATTERVPVDVCFDRDLLAQYHTAVEELADAKRTEPKMLNDPEQVRELAQRVVDLNTQLREKTRRLWFAKISRTRWRELKDAHPASKEKQDKLRAQLKELREVDSKAYTDVTVDWDAFSVAATAEAAVDPTMSLDDAIWLHEFLPDGEWTRVWEAVLQVNEQGTQIPKSWSGIVDRLASELNSTMPPPAGSPSPSSEAAPSRPVRRTGSKPTTKRRSSGSKSKT